MADDWNASAAKAQKILGKDAKIPQPKFVGKAAADWAAAWVAFKKAREDLEAKVLDMQNLESKMMNTVKQFEDSIEETNFGLDEKNKDDAKKVKDAQAILMGYCDAVIAVRQQAIKDLGELDKHLMNINKYKQATPPG
jgi:hypothetical protein